MMKMKKILWMMVLGLGVVTLIAYLAYHWGFGPYRPRFPVTPGESGEPYSLLTREQANLVADVRAIGLLRDRSRVTKVLTALKEDHPLIVISALLALGRLEAQEAIDDLIALQTKLPENSELQPFIALALARIEAGKAVPLVRDRRQLEAKIRHFMRAAKVPLPQVHKGAMWYAEQLRLRKYPRWAPFEVQVLRQVAEMASEAYEKGVEDAFKVAGFNFSLDHASQLKATLGQMSKRERIQWLVDSLSKKRVLKWEEEYEIQALADEGRDAVESIITKLREMRLHREQYYESGFTVFSEHYSALVIQERYPSDDYQRVVRLYISSSNSDPNKWDDLVLSTFATYRWWLEKVVNFLKGSVIAQFTPDETISAIWRYDDEKGVWRRTSDLSSIIALTVTLIQSEIHHLLTPEVLGDEKMAQRFIMKLYSAQPEKIANEIKRVVAISLKGEVNLSVPDEFQRCRHHSGEISNAVVCRNALLLFFHCGCVQPIPKPEDLRDWRLTQYLDIRYDDTVGESPIDEFFAPFGELKETLLRVAAYLVGTHGNPKQVIFIFYGEGGTGKTTVAGLFKDFLNGDGTIIDAREVTNKSPTYRPLISAFAAGYRLVIFTELPDTKLDEQYIKEVTDEEVFGRFLYRNPHNFQNRSVVIITTNDLPKIDFPDKAVMRRLVFVHFSQPFRTALEDTLAVFGDNNPDRPPAVDNIRQKVWGKEEFKTAFLNAVRGAWQRLCESDFKFTGDSQSEALDLQVKTEALAMHYFVKNFRRSKTPIPVKIIEALYRLWLEKRDCGDLELTGRGFSQRFQEEARKSLGGIEGSASLH